MITGKVKTPDYIRHVYKVERELKSYTVYQIAEVFSKNQLTDLLRIEKYNNRSNATGIENYLRLRTSTNWDKSEKVTGLRPTRKPRLFYGDRIKVDDVNATKRKTLLIFFFSEDYQTLFIDQGFLP